ncbi:peroxiredoxin Q/BCP [Wenzhouxiangella marina]|uniref:thioredoxin-dependent peroxiredoxin n=2 Tax=Wenzhouxiangella marina TaxID=1579979 RepID=A0A0K0XUJ3_9GAMM|nr:peroxiredoxin [Wenzhouxiangella marina]MBB6086958.1 peroxiredoxin Q/BCP [Wenzhouxiangella marina]
MAENTPKLSKTTLPATGDRELKLADFKGQALVVYFYPRDNTPGCTKQGQGFRDHYEEFQALGCEIVGVSRDTLASHERFAAKQEFPFPLLADTEEKLCNEFDVIKEKNMYGKKVMGIERSTFLFDARGKLVQEWRKVRVPGHVEAVLEAVRELA